MLDKDETAIRDINIGYQNSLAIKKEVSSWEKLYWTPKKKPAGIGEKNVTLGLPRLIELVDARKKPTTPSMEIYLDKKVAESKEAATNIARNILQTTIAHVADSSTDYSTEIKLKLNKTKIPLSPGTSHS